MDPDYKTLSEDFEEAIRYITQAFPPAEELVKPTLFHSIRVGVSLYDSLLPREVILAGLLHDTIEDTSITEDDLRQKYGDRVADLVMANTKDPSVEKSRRNEEMIKRCAEHSEDALIIKATDILDNITYYHRTGHQPGVEKMLSNAEHLFTYKPDSYRWVIFSELEDTVKLYPNMARVDHELSPEAKQKARQGTQRHNTMALADLVRTDTIIFSVFILSWLLLMFLANASFLVHGFLLLLAGHMTLKRMDSGHFSNFKSIMGIGIVLSTLIVLLFGTL